MKKRHPIVPIAGVVGKIYSWKEVQMHWGGEETYLAKRDGKIICATLDWKKNPDAPEVMVVGSKSRNMTRGEEFCAQGGAIPLLIKESTDRWRYKGLWELAGFSTDRTVVAGYENTKSGPLTRVIFLKPADDQDELSVFPDVDDGGYSAQEGKRQWRQHLRRERNRGIVKAKKQQVLAAKGKLVCEACDFNFTEFYRPHAADYCEVHHRIPLYQMKDGAVTRLEDLAIICSNCHRVIHLINPMPTVEALRAMLPNPKA